MGPYIVANFGWIKGWQVAVPVDLNYLPNTEGDRSSAPCASMR
jgi:hypothetical protein